MATHAPIADDGDKHLDVPLPHGYKTPNPFQLLLGRFKSTSTVRSVVTALADIAAILSAPLLAVWLHFQQPVAVAVFVVTMWIATARALRGLECLTHEASHYNLSRVPAVNDALGNLLAAMPAFQIVGQFRSGHVPSHHHAFGTRIDPDLARHDALDLHSIDRSTARRFAMSIARRLPRYVGGWFRNTGANGTTLATSLAWHALVYIAPLALIVGLPRAIALWAVYFAAPFILVLPVIRLVGEAAEHVYRGSNTVFNATVSNVGLMHRAIIHPHGDGYHLVHHLWPSVPHHQLAAAHQTLLEIDPDGFGTGRQRRTLTEEPPHPEVLHREKKGR